LTWSCIIQVYHFLLQFIGSISPGASSISGTSVLISNSPNPDQSPLLPETHHSTTSLSPPVVNSLSIGTASNPPVGVATSESLQKISVEGKGEFSFYQSLTVHTIVFLFAFTGTEKDRGCKRKLFSAWCYFARFAEKHFTQCIPVNRFLLPFHFSGANAGRLTSLIVVTRQRLVSTYFVTVFK